jgi:peptidoglycan/LPS O-acetylase OafA/YrhL
MLGAVLAIFTHQKISKIKLAQISKRMIMIGLILRAIVTKFGVTYTFARYALYTSFWSLVFAGVLGLALCSSPGDRLYRILSSKILIFFGAYSYGIYLIHQPVFVLLDRTKDMSSFGPTMTWLWIGGVGSLITLPCAVLIYKFFEKRFLDLKPN